MQAAGWAAVELPSPNPKPYRKTTITALAEIVAPVTPAEAKADLFGAETQSNVLRFDHANMMPESRSRLTRVKTAGGILLSID